MGVFLYIPWFKLDQWDVPLLMLSAVVLGACGIAWVAKEEWRQQAFSTAGLASVATLGAYFYGVQEVPVQPFGILVALGVLTGARVAEWQGKQWGINPAVTADFTTHIAVIGLVSCYFLNGLFYETETLLEIIQNPSLLFSRWLGLSSFGGFIGAIFAVWVWKKRRGLPALGVAECACFCFPVVWIFGRMGCFVVHDHPGAETTFFLGVQDYHGNPGVVRHDLGLYEVIWAIAATAIFMKLRHRQKRPTGFFIALLPLLYTPIRFCLDFLRATDVSNPDVRWYGLTPAQYAAIGFFFFSLWMMKRALAAEPAEIPEAMAWPPPEPEEPPKKKKKKKTASSSEDEDAPKKPAKKKKKRKKKPS